MAFAAAAVIYFSGGMVLTMAVNIPINEALEITPPENMEQAEEIWSTYASKWQVFSQIRTAASMTALILTGVGVHTLRPTAV